MSSVKRALSQTAKYLSYESGLSSYLAKRTPAARILMFHGIGDQEHPTALFERQVKFLNKHFNVVSLDYMMGKLSTGDSFTNELVLTFDDGLRNNATHAYSVLKKQNTPATFYVCPGLIDSGSWMWNQEARERLRSMPTSTRAALAEKLGCENDAKAIVVCMKELTILERHEVEDFIRDETKEFAPTAEQKNAFDMMSWDEMKSLDRNLITIGSHTTNHIIAKGLSEDLINTEIKDSKRVLEEQLGREIDHFCYPSGEFDDATVESVQQIYKSAVTTDEGLVGAGDNHFLLNRIPSIHSMSYFAWRLFRPTS